MRHILVRFLHLSAGYSLVTLAGPLVTVLLTPLYTRVLEPADYGLIEVLGTLSAIIIGIATLGMDHALSSHYFTPSSYSRPTLLRTAIILVATVSAGMSVLLVLMSDPIATILLQDASLAALPLIVAVSALGGPLYVLTGSVLRLQMNVRRVNIFGWCAILVTALGNMILVVVLRRGVVGVLAANSITYVACALLGLFMLRKDLRGVFDKSLARKLTVTGVALLPGTLGWLMMLNIDRLLLTQYVSREQLGLYSIANKLASVLGFVFNTLWAVWLPMAIEMVEKRGEIRPVARMFEYFGGLSMVLALSLGLFAPEILTFTTRSVYIPAAPYALVLMAYVGPISFMGAFFTIELYVKKHTHLLSVCYVLGTIMNIALNIILDPIFGVWGAVFATLVAGVSVFVCAYIISDRNRLILFWLKRPLAIVLIYCTLVALAVTTPYFSSLAAKCAVVFGFTLVVCILLVTRQQLLGVVWMTGLRDKVASRG